MLWFVLCYAILYFMLCNSTMVNDNKNNADKLIGVNIGMG